MSYRGTERRHHRTTEAVLHSDGEARRSHAKHTLPTTLHDENMLLLSPPPLLLLLNSRSPSSLWAAAVGGVSCRDPHACRDLHAPRGGEHDRSSAASQLRSASTVQRHRAAKLCSTPLQCQRQCFPLSFHTLLLMAVIWANDSSRGDCVYDVEDRNTTLMFRM